MPVFQMGPSGQPDDLLQAQSHEAREEKAREGVDMECHQIFCDLRAWTAFGLLHRVDKAVVRVGWVPGEPDEHGECEEGVNVDDAVQRRDVDAGGRHLDRTAKIARGFGSSNILCAEMAEIARICV